MTKSRILVVDDEPNISGLVRLILEKTQRFEVQTENRSAHALSAAREFGPDLILLDVDMPGKDGGDVSRALKSDPSLRRVPVLFLTSLVSRAEGGEQPSTRGGQPFLAKPASPKLLVETIDALLAGTLAA